jgi:hypothetical protein
MLTVKVGLSSTEVVEDSAAEEVESPPRASSISSARTDPMKIAVE